MIRITGLKASLLTTIYLFLLLALSQTGRAAEIKCWQNKQKIRECSETVPPEYAQQRIEVLNEQGIVIRIIEPRKSQAQLAEEARQAKKQQAKDERRRQDLILLKTFATENDLLASRDKKLSAIDGIISIAAGNVRVLSNSLQQLQKKAADHERAGDTVPPALIADITSVKKQIAENEKYLSEKKDKKAALKQQFAADLKRYRQLKQVRPH